MSRNLAASVSARLKQHADANKQDFNLTLTHYGLERLLYRLSVSKHASSFLLKGALLFTLWYDVAHRPTRDAARQIATFSPGFKADTECVEDALELISDPATLEELDSEGAVRV
ncbi:MAG: nucleotidyl transferase AbiEii/AbiGii toxin family protein, partial [Acidovorax sp.]|nr:nucleotidyl transferase AbiEii/AbiGii toxin family protein [Acidovorax sp.]